MSDVIKQPRKIDWVNTLYLVLSPLLLAILLPVYFIRDGIQLPMWVAFGIFMFLTSITITGGYHRLFAHKSYEAGRGLRLFYLIFGPGMLQGSVMKWATDHRRHHRFVDTEADPYNIKQGFWWAHIGWVFFQEEEPYKGVFAQDLAKDPLISWQHRNQGWLTVVMGFGFPALVGWALGSALGGFVILSLLRLVVTNHSTFFVNSLCHTWGKQPYTEQNSARDSFVMALLAHGEGYHNFHHCFQSDYRNGVRWYHWDPTKWFLRLMAWCRLVYGLKATPRETILLARMRMDEQILAKKGFPEERVEWLKGQLLAAQEKTRTLYAEYRQAKRDFQASSRRKLSEIKLDIKRSRREFRNNWALWLAYKKYGLRVAMNPSR